MSAPRHLWSGDWRDESSALGEELSARRTRASQPAQAEAPPASPRSGPSAADRLRAWLRAVRRRRRLRPRLRYTGSRRVRIGVLVGVLTLLCAGTAFAVTAALSGSGGNDQASGYQPWLGIDLYNSPFGGPIVVGVAPGSPAQAAGVQPGDVISQVDGQRVPTASQFTGAIARKHPGDQVALGLERGAATYVAHVTLANRPVGYP